MRTGTCRPGSSGCPTCTSNTVKPRTGQPLLQATGMSRAAWIALSVVVVVLGIVGGGLAAFLGSDDGSTTPSTPPAEARGFELPLADQPSVLALGGHDR